MRRIIVKVYSPSVPLRMSEETKKNRVIWEQKSVDRIEIIPDIGVLKYSLGGNEKMFKYEDNRIEIMGNSIEKIQKDTLQSIDSTLKRIEQILLKNNFQNMTEFSKNLSEAVEEAIKNF